MYITLRCKDCELADCKICPVGTYIPYWSKRGCTRKVDELTADKFRHLLNEKFPFIFMMKNSEKRKKAFQEVEDILEEVYHAPLGRVLDSNGKVIEGQSFYIEP